MGQKSTRDRIKLEALRMTYDFENAMVRLRKIQELADGHSPVINETLPSLVELLTTTTGFFESFRERL